MNGWSVHHDYESGRVTLGAEDPSFVVDYASTCGVVSSIALGMDARAYRALVALVAQPDRARATGLEADLVYTRADLLTARKDLAEFNRELHAERDDWASERAGYEGTLRAMDDADASSRNEIRELKDLVVAQAKRLAELEGEA